MVKNITRPQAAALTDPVKIDTGNVSGTILGEPGSEVRVYRGIPYAAPPVGDLRWKPPQPITVWQGIRECTAFSLAAPQQRPPSSPKLDIPQGEDCLYVNVLTPARTVEEKLPVMVWMHGGGYMAGSGNESMFNNISLPRQGIVLVNVGMRLGVFGLLAHPLLSAESPRSVSGNYLFLDMITALEWVQRNIAAFGGDPANVTIFGESGGGAKVATLLVTPLAKGLFHHAICESGSAFAPIAPGKNPVELEAVGKKLFTQLGIDDEKDPLAAARAIPWEKIMAAETAMTPVSDQPSHMWDAVVDGWLLPDTAANIFRAGKQNTASLITCANLGELTGPGSLVMPWIIPAYAAMLSSERGAGARVFACIFDQVPDGWKREGCVSFHAVELPYVFGCVNSEKEWTGLHHIAAPAGAGSHLPEISETDIHVSELMMKMWAQYARTGDPNVEGLTPWPAWEPGSDRYLYVNDTLQAKTGFSKVPGA